MGTWREAAPVGGPNNLVPRGLASAHILLGPPRRRFRWESYPAITQRGRALRCGLGSSHPFGGCAFVARSVGCPRSGLSLSLGARPSSCWRYLMYRIGCRDERRVT